MTAASHDIDALRRLARSGEPRALTTLGKRLLVGEGVPPAPEDGIGLPTHGEKWLLSQWIRSRPVVP